MRAEEEQSSIQTESLRERRKRLRRERILDAASELLREGFGQGITIPMIAERADVSQATIFNLVGPRDEIWAAMADRALGTIEFSNLRSKEPQSRAEAIVVSVVDVVTGDAEVFRALISGWSGSGRFMAHDPTGELALCFEDAKARELISREAPSQRLAELLASGLIGAVHQWAAGVLNERALRRRCRDLVSMAFAAAQPAQPGTLSRSDSTSSPDRRKSQ